MRPLLLVLAALPLAFLVGRRPAPARKPRPALPATTTRAPEPWEQEVRDRANRAYRLEQAQLAGEGAQRVFAAVRLYVLPATGESPMLVAPIHTFRGAGGGGFPDIPAAPSSLAAFLISTPAISLNWTDNSDNESGFEIQRSTDGVSWGFLAYVAANAVYYEDESGPGTFYYRVRATRPIPSDWSNTAGPITQP